MTKTVKLNYTPLPDGKATFSADPKVVQVRPEVDTLLFELGRGPSTGKVRVTFHEPQFFAKPQFNHGDTEIGVNGSLKQRTTYKCELLVNGKVEASADGAEGGAVEPVGGDDGGE